ncbi:MAG: MFS transporter, partial [Gammaproteobacteria bacterium]|nr:MFS transporter [Gammaproteobacteria bacterium]
MRAGRQFGHAKKKESHIRQRTPQTFRGFGCAGTSDCRALPFAVLCELAFRFVRSLSLGDITSSVQNSYEMKEFSTNDSPAPDAPAPNHIFRSLQVPNFRRYYLGQLISLNGTWMHSIAQAWLVYRLTGSSFMLGLVTFCNLAPVLLLSLLAGVVADRFNRRKMLIVVHSFAMLQALLLAALTITDAVEPWQIVV